MNGFLLCFYKTLQPLFPSAPISSATAICGTSFPLRFAISACFWCSLPIPMSWSFSEAYCSVCRQSYCSLFFTDFRTAEIFPFSIYFCQFSSGGFSIISCTGFGGCGYSLICCFAFSSKLFRSYPPPQFFLLHPVSHRQHSCRIPYVP